MEGQHIEGDQAVSFGSRVSFNLSVLATWHGHFYPTSRNRLYIHYIFNPPLAYNETTCHNPSPATDYNLVRGDMSTTYRPLHSPTCKASSSNVYFT